MTSYSRSLIVLSVAAALAVPASVTAQTAIPRTSGGSTTSSGSSGGGSSSGSGGSTTSSGSSGETSSRVSVPTSSTPTDARRPSGSSTSSRGTSSSDRGSSYPGRPSTTTGRTSATTGGGDEYAGAGGSRVTSAVPRSASPTASTGGSLTYSGSRPRGDRQVTGSAMERQERTGTNYNLYIPIDYFGPWGRWYPWYYGGYGYGYVSFDPWRYGVSRYSLYRYGYGYDPYDPWCFNVGYWRCDGGTGYGATTASAPDDVEDVPMASVRLRVSPASAQVYLNGALVGTVSDFSGLSNHLEVPINAALIEIKAHGYQTFVPEVEITAGRTTTVRGSLKKQ